MKKMEVSGDGSNEMLQKGEMRGLGIGYRGICKLIGGMPNKEME
jgi:hypothetical protein